MVKTVRHVIWAFLSLKLAVLSQETTLSHTWSTWTCLSEPAQTHQHPTCLFVHTWLECRDQQRTVVKLPLMCGTLCIVPASLLTGLGLMKLRDSHSQSFSLIAQLMAPHATWKQLLCWQLDPALTWPREHLSSLTARQEACTAIGWTTKSLTSPTKPFAATH